MSRYETADERALRSAAGPEIEALHMAKVQYEIAKDRFERRYRQLLGVPRNAEIVTLGLGHHEEWYECGWIALFSRDDLPRARNIVFCGDDEQAVLDRMPRVRPGPNGPIDGYRWLRRAWERVA